MSKRQKVREGIALVVRDISSQGEYQPGVVYGYDGVPAKVAKRVGLYASVEDFRWERASLRTLRRLLALADRYGVDAASLRATVEDRDYSRRHDTTFENQAGQRLTIRANFAQASSPILARYDDGEWFGTPYQVADARHSSLAACRLVASLGVGG